MRLWTPHQRLIKTIGPASCPAEMTEAFLVLRDMRWDFARRVPLGRLGRPAKLKRAVVFLTSEASFTAPTSRAPTLVAEPRGRGTDFWGMNDGTTNTPLRV